MPAPRTRFDKLLDKWTYKYEGIVGDGRDGEPKAGERTVDVEVRLCKQNRESGSAPHPTDRVWFEVICRELDLSMEGTDLEHLRLAVWGELDKKFAVKWEEWFLVRVEPASIYEGIGAGLEFTYRSVWKGVAHDGTELLREFDSHRGRGPWRISAWPGVFKDNKGKVLACILATEANEKALEAFASGVHALRKKMADFLRPEHIQDTLANLAGLAFLPPPEERYNKRDDDD